MIEKDYNVLEHIALYCEDIETIIASFGSDYDVFLENIAYYHSISMCLMQIGELTSKLSDEYRVSTRSLAPWAAIKGMRNRFAHGYGDMEDTIIWEAATKSSPALHEFCIAEIKKGKAAHKE